MDKERFEIFVRENLECENCFSSICANCWQEAIKPIKEGKTRYVKYKGDE